MVLTRSCNGDAKTRQLAQAAEQEQASEQNNEEAASSNQESATESGTSSGTTETTTSAETTTTVETEETVTAKGKKTGSTRKPADTRSRRSATSRKRLLAELEAKERLAESKVKQAQAEAELQELRVQRLGLEEDSSDVEEEDDLASVRIGAWLAQPAPPPVQEKEDSPPSRHVSGEVQPADPTRVNKNVDSSRKVGNSEVRVSVMDHPSPELKSTMIDVGTLAAALSQATRSTREPPKYIVQLPLFSGDAGEWLSFKAAYSDSHKYFTCVENIARLRRSLRGTAKEAAGCLLLSQPDPQVVLDALERRFGRPESLILTELEKVKSLNKVNDNPRDLCIFAGRIANTVGTIEALKKVYYLHNPEMVRIIVDKLTPILKNKWYDYAALRKAEDVPEMKRLSAFLNDEADKCGAYALPERVYDDTGSARTRRKIERTFNVNKHNNIVYNNCCPMCKQVHKLTDCALFLELEVGARWEIAKKNNMCFKCLNNKHRRFLCKASPCGKQGCNMKHHKLLHYDRSIESTSQSVATTSSSQETVTSATEIITTAVGQERRSYLKIVPVVLSGPHATINTYALLDDGSTITLLDAAVADMLGVDGPTKPMWIQGVGTEMKHDHSRIVSLSIKGKYSDKQHKIEAARTIDRLSISAQCIDKNDLNSCDHLIDIRDELTYERARPMILIGQDNWHLLISKQVRTGRRDQPVASRTELGWVLHGCQSSVNKTVAFCGNIKIKEESMEDLMKNFFKLESLGVEPRLPRDDPEQRALNILKEKSRRLPDGRFETGLLWKTDNIKMPNNRLDAERWLYSLERRLDRDQDLKLKYNEQMNNLFTSGYAERTDRAPQVNKTWFLSHFPVINPAKPHKPPRLVHDAAAKTAGLSLNDVLLSGPDLLQSLPGVLMRFREQRIAVSADVKEMFRQIKIIEEDRDVMRFLWRSDRREGPPQEYRMTTVLFGTTSSPCTALYIKDRNAEDYAEQYPTAATAIKVNHYMDDYLHSFATEEEAIRITKQVDFIHKQAGFQLRGWASNRKNVLCIDDASSNSTVKLGGDESEKTLGLRWDVQEDNFRFKINSNKTPIELLECRRPPTKREALSVIMAIFDPLGLIAPVTTPAKRILQDTWRYRTEWDKPLPEELQPKWNTWMRSLSNIEQLQIPRCYDYEQAMRRQLHTFVDASEEAYAAAVYWRIERTDGSIHTILAAAKSRVAPLKPVSIPRLELQAALLGARLARTVISEHSYEIEHTAYWSDSRTVLAWIRAEARTFKTFVAHRISEIEDLTKKNEWRWLPSLQNVADDATRTTPDNFNSQHRWFRGPEFLMKTEDEWPKEKATATLEITGEERVKCHVTTQEHKSHGHLPDINRFSKWTRLIRTTARVLQFIHKCRPSSETVAYKRTRKNKEKDPTWGKQNKNAPTTIAKKKPVLKSTQYIHLPACHLIAAEELWIKACQEDSFSKEISAMKKEKAPPNDGRLSTLSTYLDEKGTLRLRSRIAAATEIEATMNPPVLDGGHSYSQLFIQHTHEKLHHGGVGITVNEIRQQLWLIRLRPSVKEAINNCQMCKIKKAKPAAPSTGDLPHSRLAHHARPFTFTGLDYFGPITYITVSRHKEKRYGALFTCMTSRAIHIELVNSLSADSAIAALRRFVARRGYPKEIWSDNATCFKAADRELADSALDALQFEATDRRIKWKYIPPASPFMGGAWERMVRCVKNALYNTLVEKYPTEETLLTLLVEVENTVNSRPLTHVTVMPDDHESLTPNHILIGPNCHVPSPGNFTEKDVTAKQQWRRAQALADSFWQRWVREYLPQLQNRREPYGSGVTPQVGDIVIVCDSNLPRNTWPKGRVTQTFPGADGEVRVVDIVTKGGHIMRRPSKKLVVLPVGSPSATAGEMYTTTVIVNT